MERAVLLRRFAGFQHLDPPLLSLLAKHVRERFFAAGQVIHEEGQPVQRPILIVEGEVSLWRHGRRFRRMGPEGSAGFLAALAQLETGLRTVADKDTMALELDVDVLREVQEEQFQLLHHSLKVGSYEALAVRRRLGQAAGFLAEVHVGTVPERPLNLVDRVWHLRRIMVVAANRIDVLAELARDAEEVRLPTGHVLWKEGDSSSFLVLLVAGAVLGTTQSGQRFRFGAGDSVGGLDALADEKRWFRATVTHPLVGLRIAIESFLDLIEDNPEIGTHLLRVIAGDTERLYDQLAAVEHGEALVLAPPTPPFLRP